MRTIRNTVVFIFITVICGIEIFGQNQVGIDIDARFVKNNFEQDPDEFYVNVLRIKNNSDNSINIIPKIVLPAHWQLLTSVKPQKIKAHSTKSIPVRAMVSKLSLANTDYEIIARLLDENSLLVEEIKSPFQIMAKSNWILKAYDQSKFFQNDSEFVPVQFKLINNGNVTESINITFEIAKEIRIVEMDSNLTDSGIVLPALAEKEFLLMVTYNKNFKRNDFSSSLKVHASSHGKSEYVNFSFIKLNNIYDNYRRNQKSPNFIQISTQNPQSRNAHYRLMTKGTVKLNKGKKINYSFSNNNLSKREHFFDQSQYNFNYQTETFESGMGSGSSNLGKGLSFQKSFYSSYKHVYDSLNTLMGIVSISPFDGETNLGFGYSYKQKDVILSSSVGAGLGTSSNENSISFKQEGSMKFINKHRLTFRLSGIWEENFEAKRYSEMGYSHNITYVAPFGNYLKLWASHRFGSSSFPGSERGLSAFTSNLNYLFPKSHYVVHAAWNKIKLNPEMYDDEHRMLPESNVDKQSYSLKLSSPGTNYLGYGIGSSFTTLDTSTEIDENSVEEVSIKIYNLMMSGRLNGRYFNYKTNLSVGFINDRSGNKRPDFKLKSSAQNRNYGFAVEYQDGNAGGDYSVKQRIEKRLSISPYYKKVLFRKNLLINANTQYNYNFLSNRGRLSFNAGIDGLLRNNWKIHLASRIDCQLVKSYTAGNCKLASLEIGISKGISFSRREIEYYDVSIKFFKDENGNGVKDKEESGIGNMIAGITKTAPLPGKENATNEGHAADHFKFISLASNKQGDIKMEYMPEGIYEVNITSSKNLYGYFNFKGNEHVFQLDEEKTVNIPYEKAGKIYGQLKIKRDAFSDMGLVSAEDIRIVAVSSEGKEFTSLTGRNGQFILYVPQNSIYKVSISNPFGSKMKVLKNNIEADLREETSFKINFNFNEKGRKINFNKN